LGRNPLCWYDRHLGCHPAFDRAHGLNEVVFDGAYGFGSSGFLCFTFVVLLLSLSWRLRKGHPFTLSEDTDDLTITFRQAIRFLVETTRTNMNDSLRK
jgi:hypothetical protein